MRVTLSNADATNAYRPERYGDAIIVERTLGRTPGASSKYTTYAANKRMVADRREEIHQLCDHFSLQVDNPLSVLTQETAKRFLAAARPKELYEFFARATQLEQLATDYAFAQERIQEAEMRIGLIKETWAPQQAKIRELERQFEALSRQRDVRRAINTTKGQLTWRLVMDKEAELETLRAAVQKRMEKLAELEAKKAGIQERSSSVQEKIAGLQRELAAASERLEPLRAEHQGIDDQIRAARLSVSQLESQMREVNMSYREEAANLERLEAQIAEEEARRQEGGAAGQAAAVHGKIRELEEGLLGLHGQLKEAREEEEALKAARGDANVKAERARQLFEDASSRLAEKRGQAEQLRRAQGDRLRLFGDRMPQLIEDIERNASSFHRKPVGPIGMYVELKERKWALPVEAIIGKELDSFIVKDQHDHDRLLELFRRRGLRNPIIILPSDAPIDLAAGGEPDPRYTTALRVLEIRHPLVLKALVIQTSLETAVLVESRPQARDLLRRRERKVESAFTPHDRVFVTAASHSSVVLYSYGPKASMILGDNRGQLKQLEESLSALDAERRRYGEDKKALEEAAARASFDLLKAGSRAQQLERQLSSLKSELQVLENERRSLASLSFQTFEEDRRKSLETLAMLKAQIGSLFAQHQAADQRIAALSAELEENSRQQAAIKDETEGVLEAMAQESAFRRDADKDLRTLEASRSYEETEVSTLANRVAAMETELASMVSTALTIGPRTAATSKAATVLSKELRRLTMALEEMARNQPDPARLAAELDAARAAFEKSRSVVKAEEQMIDKLTSTVVKRQEMWRIWRAGIIKRSMVEFILMLAARDFQGNLAYDNEACELTIRVRPKAQVLSDKLHRQQARDMEGEEDGAAEEEERDVRQLSGGEKSYSTSCFLFSLWSSMAAPLRCLDEFDVFMDNVNRDYVIQELVKCARSSGVQFILITPNPIWNSIKMDCDIKVIRLADPDRQQGVLA